MIDANSITLSHGIISFKISFICNFPVIMNLTI